MTGYLIIAVCMLALCMPLAAFMAFRMGMGFEERTTQPKLRREKIDEIHWKENEEQRKTNIVHDNIENYGTACPQKEVK